MNRTLVAAIAFLGAGGQVCEASPQTSVSVLGVTLKSVDVVYPQSEQLFSGDQMSDAINANCLTCHSIEMVLYQPLLSRTIWGDEVSKMKKAYGAPVPLESVEAIVDYLAGLQPGNETPGAPSR